MAVTKRLHDGSHVTAYPITQSQQMMYFLFNSYGSNVPVLNIGSGYYWKGELDEKLMREALTEAVERCDTMRLRFAEDRQYGLVQYICEDSGIEIEVEDLTSMTRQEAWWHFKQETYKMIDMFEKPLHTLKIVKLADGYNGLYLKFHHLAMDGYSVKVFLGDVMGIYVHKRTGAPYPKPMQPYVKAVEKELEYLTSEQRNIDRQFWHDTFANTPEPIYTDYLLENRLYKQREETGNPNLRCALVHSGSPEARSLYYEMDAEESASIMKACHDTGMSVACVLMIGLRTALSAFNDNEKDVSFKLMINRRGSLLEKKSGGLRFHFFQLRTIIEPETTFAEAVQIASDEQDKVFRHSSFATMEMYNMKHAIMNLDTLDKTYEGMSFSYQPLMEIPCESEEMRKSSYGVWYNNDVSMQNLYLTVKHRTDDNGFEFIFEYRTNSDPQKDLEIFYDRLRRALLIGTANPSITMGEILKQIEL